MIYANEIVPGDRSGGTVRGQTIIVHDLVQLLQAVSRDADASVYELAVLEDNVLGKETIEARRLALRNLRNLYLLRPDSILFRALHDLWTDDVSGQPLLAGLCAAARDAVFRASAGALYDANPGDSLTSADFANAVDEVFPGVYNGSTLATISRNTFSSWEQVGHLEAAARTEKLRRRPVCTPATTAYALLLGHLSGTRGEALFDTAWVRILDRPRPHLFELATVASQRSLIDFRHSGGVVEIGFTELLRAMDGQLL